ncbi:MAG TPA: acyl-CoA reductase [Chitinophagaceae bacterium]
MNLQYRIDLLVRLGEYILSDDERWQDVKEKASYENGWFIPTFIDIASNSIARNFLQKDILEKWSATYRIPAIQESPKTIGIVMAGNIPLVGFHDLLCVFIAGHRARIKTSSKDEVLIKHLVDKLIEWDESVAVFITFAGMLKGCNAYIATGSNNSAGYFEYYFGKYPHIIRRNRTSVAVLDATETITELEQLADDVYLYFGLGCRNVTKIYVPRSYDFVPLLQAFKKFDYLADHHKYKNNYDYNLAILILNKKYYMSNPSLILVEDTSLFSPISQLNYEYYDDASLTAGLAQDSAVQAIVGKGFIPFGQSQFPAIDSYADGVDTLHFVSRL